MEPLARFLVLTGIALVVVGVVLHIAPALPGLGRLPGDIRIERPGLRVYVPITTCLLLSAVLSLAWWILSRWR